MRPQSRILKTVFSLRLVPSLLPSSPLFLSYIVYLFPFFCYSYMKPFLLCNSSEKRHGALFVYLFVCLEWDSFTMQPCQAWYSQSSCLSLLNILLNGSPPSTWDKVSHLPGDHWFGGAGCSTSFRDPPVSQCWDYRPAPYTPNFTWVLGILILAWQALWQLIHLLGLILELDWTEQKICSNPYINIFPSYFLTQVHDDAGTWLTVFT